MRIAVYGTLKKGFGNNSLLRNEVFVRNDTVSGFDMYSLGGFPGIIPSPEAKTPVVVEVYDVSEHALKRLDMLEGHPHFYERTKVTLDSGDEASLYIYRHEVNHLNKVESGNWKR